MVMAEEYALDVLLFGVEGEELLDFKCFRGDREDVSPEDIAAAIHSGIMQHKMQPNRASSKAPSLGVEPCDVAEFVKTLPIAA